MLEKKTNLCSVRNQVMICSSEPFTWIDIRTAQQESLVGFYQRDDFVTVGELRRELDLCFRLDEDDGQPALIPAHSSGAVIIPNRNNSTPFPTPLPNTKSNYCLVSHSPGGNTTHRPVGHNTRSLALGKSPGAAYHVPIAVTVAIQ